LPDPYTLYLKIFKDTDGALLGAFRNPEQNARGPAAQFQVARVGDTLHLTAGEDPAAPEFRLDARVLSGPDRIRIHSGLLGRDIDLERRTNDEAASFFPRPPGRTYAYEVPAATSDGWRTASAGEVGIDEAAITKMIQGIAGSDPAAIRPSLIHSLLIARHGKLFVEEYFFRHGRDLPHDLRSAAKTFSSVLLGAIMKDTPSIGPDTRLYPALALRGPFANPDPRKSGITLAHLMTHSAGLACNDYDEGSPGSEDLMQSQTKEPDWWKYTLDLPMAHDPGTRYAYCSANINLVGGVLTTLTDTWLPELFRREIADPLQFGEWHWNLQPTDEGYLGGGAFLRPRDLLKIGQMYLDDGRWKGRFVVAPAWVRQSTSARMKVTPETTGLTPEEFGDYYFEGADALAWHMNSIHAGERTYNAYAATGNGGQLLIVIPEMEMAVVFTGGNYLQGGIWNRWADQFIGGQIIPAIHKGEEK
jgi:CubicO group peptidase (beta-lactamase class C family)